MTNRESDRYPELTEEKIDICYEVLEIVREDFNETGMVGEEKLINNAHALVQRFDEGVNWVDPIEVNE
jgi:hypothetical protein